MSNLSFIEKLLDGFEVEWKPLGEVYKFQYGMGNTIPTLGGEYPVYGSNGIVGTHNEFNSEDSPVIGHIGAYAGIVNWGRGKHFVTYNGVICKLISGLVNAKYAYHFLLKQDFNSIAKSASHPFISYAELNKVLIPIPCPDNPKKSLEIQAEIVRILDTFTELTTELTTELNARKKQYNYYRDQLLSYEEGEVEWKTLGGVSTKVSSGGTPLSTRHDFYDGDIPWLRTQEVCFNEIFDTDVKITELAVKESSAKWIPDNCVIVAISGATAARSAINKIPLTTNQHCCNLEINPVIANYRYVFHWVRKEHDKLKSLGQGARGDLNSGIIKDYPIPIPYADNPEKSLSEQARIASILDKFDALANSISEGLPREIELRQRQYEYYRDLLLSFPKPEEVAA